MKLRFHDLPARLTDGMADFAKEYGFSLEKGGLEITLRKTDEKILEVTRKGNEAQILYAQPVGIFRGVSLLLQHEKEENYHSRETVYFKTNGVMIDGSQRNQLITVSATKWLLRMMAAMGLNMLMLYTEDNYDIEGEPYFGYMRPRYSQADYKAIDDYAYSLGIEVIPCMQTLAHMPDMLRWNAYADIRDDQWTMLVGEEKTYRLIEKMLAASSAPFRTKRIHIGMDEAWNMGLGQYLEKNGYRSKHEIMAEHMIRVMEIVRKLGLQPMMWADMFFRTVLPNSLYRTMDEIRFPQDIIDSVPPEMGLIYWDYRGDSELIAKMIKDHKRLSDQVIFAGCVRNNRSFCYNHHVSTKHNHTAYMTCKQEGVEEMITTIWGDNAPENTVFNTLLGLQYCAEHGYKAEVEEKDWFDRFHFCCHAEAEEFIRLSQLDFIEGANPHPSTQDNANPSHYLLWQDPLMGLFDANLPEKVNLMAYYQELGEYFEAAAKKNAWHRIMYTQLEKAAKALALKAELGRDIRSAYLAGEKEALKALAEKRIPDTIQAVKALRSAHYDLWMAQCKPAGWEIIDLHYGGLLGRLETAIRRIQEYLDGKFESLPELEEARLPYNGRKGLVTITDPYPQLVSASRL